MPDDGAVARKYVDQVIAGEVIVGRLVRMAVERHVRDLDDGHTRGLRFDESAGARAIKFFEFLRHSKGEWGRGGGQVFTLAPWQAFILWVLFGWRRADGTRRFRIAYIEIPRKNGKSTFSAGIGLYLLVADNEPGAEVYTAATKRDQARIVHMEAVRMVKKSAVLRKRIRSLKDNLHVEATNSKYEPLGADGDTMDGLNVHGAIIDEYHQHKTGAVWDALDTATGSRTQPLILAITTAGFSADSACAQERDYCVSVLQSINATDAEPFRDDSRFAFIATIDQDDDWRDPKSWAKANPNLGVSVKLDDLQRKAIVATRKSRELNTFLTKHLNVWTRQKTAWLNLDKWDQAANAAAFVANELKGKRCWGGLDLSKTSDLTALIWIFEDLDDSYQLLPFFWMPEERAEERDKAGEFPYLACAEKGLITLTDGNSVDYRFIRTQTVECFSAYDVQSLAFDPWNARHLVTELVEEDGIEAAKVVEFRQNVATFNEPTKFFEELVNAGKLHHGGNSVLRWMASNASVKTDPSGNIRPVKPEHLDPKKIDGIVAAIMGLGRAMISEPESQPSVF